MSRAVLRLIVAVFVSLFCVCQVQAIPLDLNAFTPDGDVDINVATGVVTIDEASESLWGSYFFDEDFFVDTDALYLSVNYTLTSGVNDLDYVASYIDFYPTDLYEAGPTSGTYTLDLTSYRNSSIRLEFGLEPDGWYDGGYGSIVTFSNFDYVTESNSQAPVPEPSTILLFGAGLAGLAGVSRRKRFIKTQQ